MSTNQNKIIDGKALAEKLGEELKKKLGGLKERPLVVSILIGNDPNSLLYTQMKQKKAEEFNIDFLPIRFSENSSFDSVAKKIQSLNKTDEVKGIMIQLPIPRNFLRNRHKSDLIELINPDKDIDGMLVGSPYLSATVKGVLKILDVIASGRESGGLSSSDSQSRLDQPNKNQDSDVADAPRNDNAWYKNTTFGVVGSEGEVGKPLVDELEKRHVREVLRLDKRNPKCDLGDLKKADVVISCTGVQGLVSAEMIKEGAIVIDVGLGDFESAVHEKASMYTPKFGGVGPLTIISLMENILEAAGKD